jgi:uncharacterized protein
MKFQPDTPTGVNVISRQDPGRVWVGPTPFETSLLVPWAGPVLPWPVQAFEELNAELFEQIVRLDPELVIFGSGSQLRFPRPQWLQALIGRRIGVETMDTPAACRTYNVLVSEQRSVVAALIIETGTGPAKNL